MTTESAVTVTTVADDVDAAIAASPSWLGDRRRASWDAFSALPWPSTMRDEDWRRTDVSKLKPGDFHRNAEPGPDLDALIVAAAARVTSVTPEPAIVVCDSTGRVQRHGTDALEAQGVLICSLEEAAERHTALMQRGLAVVPGGAAPLTSLWNATWRGGVFVYVPRSIDASVPLWVIHAAAGDHVATTPAVVCVLDENSSLALFEFHASPPNDVIFSNGVTAIYAGRDARIDHGTLQVLGISAWQMATQRAHLEGGAQLRFFGASFGSRLQKAYWEAVLGGAGATASMAGIALGSGAQHLDHQTLQAHTAPDTTSKLTLKVAVRDSARSVYSGLIDVDRTAQRTDAYVKNQNLILSQGAKADSIPRLEIRAHDVKCGHGSTAGHIDDNQRFYLMARGVAADEADRIILRGFLDDALSASPHPAFSELVSAVLDSELGSVERGDALVGDLIGEGL